MARGSPTDADRELADYFAGFGYLYKAPSFEYWRGQGALPPRLAPGKGRGRGRGSGDRPETPALALGICRFLDKRGGIADRPDLPRRRRLAEAPLWLWYERYPIPSPTVRDAVAACFVGLDERLEKRRARAEIDEPEAATYERITAAADAEIREAPSAPLLRRQVRAFAQMRAEFADSTPAELAQAAASQLIQALQGHADPEPKVFATGIEFAMVLGGAPTVPLATDADAEALARHVSIQNIVQTVWRLTARDWRDVREVLRAIQGTTLALRASEDASIRRSAQAIPLVDNVASLVAAIGALAVNLDALRERV